MPIQVLQQPQDLEVQDLKVSVAALWLGRVLSGLAILFLLFDGAIKLVPLSVVTETMDRIGYGSSETLARSLAAITVACTLLYAVPPTSFVGAILLTGYLGGAIASHVRIGSPLFTHVLFGLYLGLMVWGGLWLRDARLRQLLRHVGAQDRQLLKYRPPPERVAHRLSARKVSRAAPLWFSRVPVSTHPPRRIDGKVPAVCKWLVTPLFSRRRISTPLSASTGACPVQD